MRDWVTNIDDTFYVIGSVAGPHPYPMMVRDFNSVSGANAWRNARRRRSPAGYRRRLRRRRLERDGIFYPYIADPSVRLVGVEAGGAGIETGRHAATLCVGAPGFCTARFRICCKTRGRRGRNRIDFGRLGLSGRGAGAFAPERHWPRRICGRDRRRGARGFRRFVSARRNHSGFESAHALACAQKLAPQIGKDGIILVNLSGRGDKDLQTVLRLRGLADA